MSKLATHLAKHLDGEVVEDPNVLEYFAIDGSIFRIPPRIVVFPRHTTDIRKAVRFSWQLAERGHILPITARGKGTDLGGAALGPGMILAMPAHMNKVLGFNKTDVVVQPGVLFGSLQRVLESHGRFLPPYPASLDYSTVGGAVANNASGVKSVKYGPMANYVKGLEVVLANGQLISATKLTARELNKKKGQVDFEGEIYRQLDGLIEDNQAPIAQTKARFYGTTNSTGYNLWDIKGKDGSFDLSKMFCGAQGTLGIITAVTLATEPYNSQTDLVMAFFDNAEQLSVSINMLTKLGPSAMELVDRAILEAMHRQRPQQLDGLLDGGLPQYMLLVEFDDAKARDRATKVKRAMAALTAMASQVNASQKSEEQERWWQLPKGARSVLAKDSGKKKPLPIIEDGAVPTEHVAKFIGRLSKLLEGQGMEAALWGPAGSGHLHVHPLLDLSGVGDRQALMRLMDEFYKLVIDMGGTTSGQHNDGRLRAPYLRALYGNEMYGLFGKVKQIFDPHNILNPGVKLGFDKEDFVPILRHEYSVPHAFDHTPFLS